MERWCPVCTSPTSGPVPLAASLLKDAGLTDQWTATAVKCRHCGTVFSDDENSLVQRGFFVGDQVEAWRWRPYRR